MECYFKGNGHWEHVRNNEAIQLEADNEDTQEMITNRCKKAIMDSLHPDILKIVRRRPTPQAMLQRIERIFVGNTVNQKQRLYDKLLKLRFAGNYFCYVNDVK